jgi:hypothetical protein
VPWKLHRRLEVSVARSPGLRYLGPDAHSNGIVVELLATIQTGDISLCGLPGLVNRRNRSSNALVPATKKELHYRVNHNGLILSVITPIAWVTLEAM